jgi:hypothetical protein
MANFSLAWIGFFFCAIVCLSAGRIALRESARLPGFLFTIGAAMSGMMCAYFAASAKSDVPSAFRTMFSIVAAIAILSLIAGWITRRRQNRS